MYGFLQSSLISLLKQYPNFEERMRQIKDSLGYEGNLDDFFLHYDDTTSFSFLGKVAESLGMSQEECLSKSGELALDTFISNGYMPILQTMGHDFFTFINSLDAMHDNFLAAFPKMKMPSFRPRRNDDGTMTIHYYSRRKFLAPYAMSMIKGVAKALFDLDIQIEHSIKKGYNRADHDEFLITAGPELFPPEAEEDAEDIASNTTVSMDSAAIDRLFPWHFAFDEELKIVSIGSQLRRHLNANPIGSKLTDIMAIQRPLEAKYRYDDFQQRSGNPYQLALHRDAQADIQIASHYAATDDNSDACSVAASELSNVGCPFSGGRRRSDESAISSIDRMQALRNMPQRIIQLHGEFVALQEGQLFFAGAPLLRDVKQLDAQGITMSDLPVHSHASEILYASMFQAMSAKRANKADKELLMLNNNRDEVRRQQEITANLLHSILPPRIADALTKGETPPAETFPATTILFSDIVGFTSISGSVPPEEVMAMLNELFAKFDDLTRLHGVYKVETVGDAYVVSCGAPDPCDNHAERMCNFAIDMVRVASSVISPLDGEPLKIRCGLHSGTVMTGCVGNMECKPRYCLFGDTVNVASRMESTGLPASIQISYRVIRALPDASQYNIITRGRIAIKGKGTMKTFLLLGHADSLDPPLYPKLSSNEREEEVWNRNGNKEPVDDDSDSARGPSDAHPSVVDMARSLRVRSPSMMLSESNLRRMNQINMRESISVPKNRWPSPKVVADGFMIAE